MISLAALVAAVAVGLPAAQPALKLDPVTVAPGGTISVTGSGFRAGQVTLAAGPPQSEADPFATVQAGAEGRFKARMPIHAGAVPGPYVLVACENACRLRATARFTVARRPSREQALVLTRQSLQTHAKACGFTVLGLTATAYSRPVAGWRVAARLRFSSDGHVDTATYVVVTTKAVPAEPLAGEIDAGCP